MCKFFYLIISFYCIYSCQKQKPDLKNQKSQELIIEESLKSCAYKYNYIFHMKEWQDCIDEGLKQDKTIAYLWQQKAMPYFKARKYEVGMEYLKNAVKYDRARFLPYQAFIKCIFIKDYKGAIDDFKECVNQYGNTYEMDHLYTFYIGISYLQLNKFKEAQDYLNIGILEEESAYPEAHFLDYFYYGISLYEQEKFQDSINYFDKALKQYDNFSDVEYYKAIALYKLGKEEESTVLLNKAKEDASKAYSFTEDNAIYETYPYQVRW